MMDLGHFESLVISKMHFISLIISSSAKVWRESLMRGTLEIKVSCVF